MSPPRDTADRNVDSVPNVNAWTRKSGSRNIGCAERRSTAMNATSDTSAPLTRIKTRGLVQPVGCPPAGRMP